MRGTLRVLVWQWGRRGAGPRFALELAGGLRHVENVVSMLSLSRQSELMEQVAPPQVELAYATYTGLQGFMTRILTMPLLLPGLIKRLQALRPDIAICAMPAPLDLLMSAALRRLGVPYWVVIHDADSHPGDGFPFQMKLQRRLADGACGLVALSAHVAARLREQNALAGRPLIVASHPPFNFGPPPPPPASHGGPLRLLFFGRLLPYKGLDLFADALGRLGPRADIEVRIAGLGAESTTLAQLRAMPNVTVDRRWIPEGEIGNILAWADALVLSHREASQSGVAAAAIAARRWVVATEVGGLAEQLAHEPLARLCPPTADGVAQAILGLLTDPLGTAAPHSDTGWVDFAHLLIEQIEARQPAAAGR